MGLFRRVGSIDAATALAQAGDGEAILLDVREQHEWSHERVRGAKHIPLSRLGGRIGELPADRPIIAFCRSGHRSAAAARTLTRAGYTALSLRGGIVAWKRAGLPVSAGR